MSRTTTPGPRDEGLLAGDVAKALRVGVQTLHFYERQGLIAPPPRSGSGYRLYPLETVERLRFIRKARAIGLSLQEIKEILELAGRGTSPCGTVEAALVGKLRELDARLVRLQIFRRDLRRLVARVWDLKAQGADTQVCAIVEQAPSLANAELAMNQFGGRLG